ncbi:hypothetical protein ABK040_002166 [Willaertia magna]
MPPSTLENNTNHSNNPDDPENINTAVLEYLTSVKGIDKHFIDFLQILPHKRDDVPLKVRIISRTIKGFEKKIILKTKPTPSPLSQTQNTQQTQQTQNNEEQQDDDDESEDDIEKKPHTYEEVLIEGKKKFINVTLLKHYEPTIKKSIEKIVTVILEDENCRKFIIEAMEKKNKPNGYIDQYKRKMEKWIKVFDRYLVNSLTEEQLVSSAEGKKRLEEKANALEKLFTYSTFLLDFMPEIRLKQLVREHAEYQKRPKEQRITLSQLEERIPKDITSTPNVNNVRSSPTPKAKQSSSQSSTSSRSTTKRRVDSTQQSENVGSSSLASLITQPIASASSSSQTLPPSFSNNNGNTEIGGFLLDDKEGNQMEEEEEKDPIKETVSYKGLIQIIASENDLGESETSSFLSDREGFYNKRILFANKKRLNAPQQPPTTAVVPTATTSTITSSPNNTLTTTSPKKKRKQSIEEVKRKEIIQQEKQGNNTVEEVIVREEKREVIASSSTSPLNDKKKRKENVKENTKASTSSSAEITTNGHKDQKKSKESPKNKQKTPPKDNNKKKRKLNERHSDARPVKINKILADTDDEEESSSEQEEDTIEFSEDEEQPNIPPRSLSQRSNASNGSVKSTSNSSNSSNTTGRSKIFWTLEEVDALKKGVKRFGEGSWGAILAAYKNVFNPKRNSISLRDKWRNLVSYGHIEPEELI